MTDDSAPVPIVDSHLDLAENATFCGRDLTLSVQELRERESRTEEQAMVTLPELRKAGVAVAFATIFAGVPAKEASPERASRPGVYATPEEAGANAHVQIDLYEEWEARGLVRLIRSVDDLDHHLQLWRNDRLPGLVLLMEGADPIARPEDLPKWWERGIRMIGLTWDDTKYGTGVGAGSKTIKRGGLTADGVALLEGMAELGVIWDVSHLAEDAIRQGLELQGPRVCASHANAQALTPTDRHLSDEVIRAIAERDGVIGITLCNSFLDPEWKDDKSAAITLEHVRRHTEHLAGIGGWRAVGIGSDLDGGFGLEESPAEMNTIADLQRLGSLAPAEHRSGMLGGNWLRFLRTALPRRS